MKFNLAGEVKKAFYFLYLNEESDGPSCELLTVTDTFYVGFANFVVGRKPKFVMGNVLTL